MRNQTTVRNDFGEKLDYKAEKFKQMLGVEAENPTSMYMYVVT